MTTPPKQPSAATVEQEVPVEIWNIIEECVQDLNAICTGNGRQVRLTPYFQRAITSATADLRRELEAARKDKERLDWLDNRSMGSSNDATIDDLVMAKGWTRLRAAIDSARSATAQAPGVKEP